jgi:DNA-directed RNA polymerase subunit RPC12/RpoP
MRKCGQCGGRLKRVHRTFFERFSYMAIYQCRDCQREEFLPRHYMLHFGPKCRCPRCGTERVIRLKERDKIDPLHTGFLNFTERVAGGKLHHCRYCRIQFYDRRPLASELDRIETLTTPPDTAMRDAKTVPHPPITSAQ